ncbi:hypothetical protein AKO1_004526 [Acrasis kona]|uniref:Uncharacterized protein n=1 Tax=Acrasis kona TaxID=1008807 RepID=A0AAW2Z5J4_9EUKA
MSKVSFFGALRLRTLDAIQRFNNVVQFGKSYRRDMAIVAIGGFPIGIGIEAFMQTTGYYEIRKRKEAERREITAAEVEECKYKLTMDLLRDRGFEINEFQTDKIVQKRQQEAIALRRQIIQQNEDRKKRIQS